MQEGLNTGCPIHDVLAAPLTVVWEGGVPHATQTTVSFLFFFILTNWNEKRATKRLWWEGKPCKIEMGISEDCTLNFELVSSLFTPWWGWSFCPSSILAPTFDIKLIYFTLQNVPTRQIRTKTSTLLKVRTRTKVIWLNFRVMYHNSVKMDRWIS